MNIEYEDIFWDLFKSCGGIDAYICYSAYKKEKKKAADADKGIVYEHF